MNNKYMEDLTRRLDIEKIEWKEHTEDKTLFDQIDILPNDKIDIDVIWMVKDVPPIKRNSDNGIYEVGYMIDGHISVYPEKDLNKVVGFIKNLLKETKNL